jgi:glycosyltransferase involved in cell wall biosynthesis
MRISVVTPSFRQPNWLRLCCSSVADQAGAAASLQIEHIVQDGCSGPEVATVCNAFPKVVLFQEKDQGMYDAINRGLRRSRGDILAYLNCDEQYLPGALARVHTFFEQHPDVDVVFGDAVVVGSTGEYLCHRRALLPTSGHSLVSGNLAILTCATFFRRRLIEEKGLYFDAHYRELGDAHWVLAMLEHHTRMGLLGGITSAFTNTGDNMSLKPNAVCEKKHLMKLAPSWLRAVRHAVIIHYRLRKLLAGHYSDRPFDYAIYTASNPSERTVFHVSKPSTIWKT